MVEKPKKNITILKYTFYMTNGKSAVAIHM